MCHEVLCCFRVTTVSDEFSQTVVIDTAANDVSYDVNNVSVRPFWLRVDRPTTLIFIMGMGG